MTIETIYWTLIGILIVMGAGFVILFWTLLSILLEIKTIAKWVEWMALFEREEK